MRNLVVGLYRSGTTATMKAAIAGGLHAIYTPEPPLANLLDGLFTEEEKKSWVRKETEGMTPKEILRLREDISRWRFREPTPEMLQEDDFPLAYPDECLVKYILQPPSLPWILKDALTPSDDGYRVLFIWRHPHEIRISIEERLDWRRNPERPVFASVSGITQGDWYEREMMKALAYLRGRPDVKSLVEIQYAPNFRADLPALITDTEEIFETLASEGWPLDVDAAVASIDASRWNVKAEEISPERVVA